MSGVLGDRDRLEVVATLRRLAEVEKATRRHPSGGQSLADWPRPLPCRILRTTMPEGHTIHRYARQQTNLLAGRKIRVSSPQGRFAADAARIDGATLMSVMGHGKHLFYRWSTGEVGHVHLGLFGKFRVRRTPESPAPVGEVRMRLQTPPDEERAEFVTIDLSGPTACSVDPPSVRREILARLGPDPIRRAAKPDAMISRIARSRRGIGDLLMDQSVIAGVGNVYRAEALFACGLHPLRPGNECDPIDLHALWQTVQGMLRQGVKDGRIVTVSREDLGIAPNARIPRGEATYVYKRDRCLRCGDEIRRITIANRTCYYCPTDQPN
jgi:endonuclease-8